MFSQSKTTEKAEVSSHFLRRESMQSTGEFGRCRPAFQVQNDEDFQGFHADGSPSVFVPSFAKCSKVPDESFGGFVAGGCSPCTPLWPKAHSPNVPCSKVSGNSEATENSLALVLVVFLI